MSPLKTGSITKQDFRINIIKLENLFSFLINDSILILLFFYNLIYNF